MKPLKLFAIGLMSIATTQLLAAPADDFVTTWKTDNPDTSNSTSIRVPMRGGPYDVDWDNDGTFDQFGITNTVTHDFGVVGTYTIRIFGSYDSIRITYSEDHEKILSLDQWGTASWTTMQDAFYGAVNLRVPATDTPDFSAVTDMSAMFANATSANPDISGWDTSSVSSVAPVVYGMRGMFANATSANPDVSGWDTSSETNMGGMFTNATSFDRDIGSWDVSSLINADVMFGGVTLFTANYDSLLVGWNAQALQPGVSFSGGNSTYCSTTAIAARDNMVASDSWVIRDGGRSCPPNYYCNVNTVSATTEYFDTTHEACEILVLGPDFIAADGSNISANSGWEIDFLPGFLVEQGATLNANVCGQSLCMTSP